MCIPMRHLVYEMYGKKIKLESTSDDDPELQEPKDHFGTLDNPVLAVYYAANIKKEEDRKCKRKSETRTSKFGSHGCSTSNVMNLPILETPPSYENRITGVFNLKSSTFLIEVNENMEATVTVKYNLTPNPKFHLTVAGYIIVTKKIENFTLRKVSIKKSWKQWIEKDVMENRYRSYCDREIEVQALGVNDEVEGLNLSMPSDSIAKMSIGSVGPMETLHLTTTFNAPLALVPGSRALYSLIVPAVILFGNPATAYSKQKSNQLNSRVMWSGVIRIANFDKNLITCSSSSHQDVLKHRKFHFNSDSGDENFCHYWVGEVVGNLASVNQNFTFDVELVQRVMEVENSSSP